MTDNSNETTEVLPVVEAPAVEASPAVQAPAASAPAVEYTTPASRPLSGTSKALIAVAATVFGLMLLGATFASGVAVGSHIGGARGGFAARQGQFGGPGGGMMNGRGFEEGRRGQGFRHGNGGFGGQYGQTEPQGQLPPGHPDSQGQPAPQGQTAPDGVPQ